MLDDIAYADTEAEMEKHVSAFTAMPFYTSNPNLQKYWSIEWAPYIQQWAKCYRTGFYMGHDTNNFNESMNRAIKYTWFATLPDQRVDIAVKMLHEKVVPSYFTKHVRNNLKAAK